MASASEQLAVVISDSIVDQVCWVSDILFFSMVVPPFDCYVTIGDAVLRSLDGGLFSDSKGREK